MQDIDVIILAGGMGTRLKSVISDIPKPMAPINDIPFLEYLIRSLANQSFQRIIISTGYKGEVIENYFGEGSNDVSVDYYHEVEPLGTGGAIKAALSQSTTDKVLILNGDTFFNIDIQSLVEFHNNCRADISIAMRMVEDEDRYGSLNLDEENRVLEFTEKVHTDKGYINGGIYLINCELFNSHDLPEKFSLENDFFAKYVESLKIYGKAYNDYFIDIGIPEDYEKACRDLPELF